MFVLRYYIYGGITVWTEKGFEKQLCLDAFVKGKKSDIALLPPGTILMTLFYLSIRGKKVCHRIRIGK